GNPFSNALFGVYNSYTQASAKPSQDYLYHDVSWFLQDSWKISPRLTLDLGVRFSWYQPVYNAVGPATFFNPTLFDATKAPRIYRPVCVGASTCASGAANPPFVFQPSLNFGFLKDITPGGGGLLGPSAISGVNKNSDFPTIYSFSIGVQRTIGAGTVVDVSYVGSQSRSLARKTNL